MWFRAAYSSSTPQLALESGGIAIRAYKMNAHIKLRGRRDLAGQIYRQIRASIVDGRLAPGERLPSTRTLASELDVSRKTTLDVFERLIGEGYLRSRTGDGTFVSDEMTRLAPTPPRERIVQATGAVWETLPEALPASRKDMPARFDFVGGVTDKRLFPFDKWRKCVSHALRIQARGNGSYHDPSGDQELRLAISRYLASSRAVVSNWQDVIVTNGAQQAIELLARAVIRPGDVIAVEDPGYPPARSVFTAAGARVIDVPVDKDGLRVDALPSKARMVYVTPSHQFPLGMPMTLERRLALLEWAHRRGALVIEDDYDGEYRFEGRPMESLKSLDNAGVVAYVGTFSKTIFPELRIGYMIPPSSLAATLRKAKQVSDWHSSTLMQTALGKFMPDGYFAKHLRHMHREYARRRATLLEYLQGDLADVFTPLPSVAGIHLVAILADDTNEADIIARANQASVGLYGISRMFNTQPSRQGILFGYGGIGVDDIRSGLTQLGETLRATRR